MNWRERLRDSVDHYHYRVGLNILHAWYRALYYEIKKREPCRDPDLIEPKVHYTVSAMESWERP